LYLVDRTIRFVRGVLLSYGPQGIKQRVWDREYRRNMWQFRDHTAGDCVYPHLESHTHHGSILDLGCGSGNTATELSDAAYASYLGVDISEAALEKASTRTKESGREEKNRFARADFLEWQPPSEQFDVILFRESMYHVPLNKVKTVLDRYSKHLKNGGVFIVRVFAANKETAETKHRPNAMLRIIENEFEVVEKRRYETSGRPTVVVFRPKQQLSQSDVERAG
jgi:2-polyprenyl-3-methyl-5-hydroxy-6-metoxy-1,4-benzoquinol methylase